MQDSEQPQRQQRSNGNTSPQRAGRSPVDPTSHPSSSGSRASKAQGPYTSYGSRQRTTSERGVSRPDRSSRSSSNYMSPRQLPSRGLWYSLIAGAIVGVLAILFNVVLTLSNSASFRAATNAANVGNVATSITFLLAGLACLNLFVIGVMLLIMGFIVGRLVVRRRFGFFAGVLAGALPSLVIFLERYIPNYPSNSPTSSATNALTLIVALVLILIAGILGGLVSLLGTWIATRRHPYYAS